jgi:hypothetical protein
MGNRFDDMILHRVKGRCVGFMALPLILLLPTPSFYLRFRIAIFALTSAERHDDPGSRESPAQLGPRRPSSSRSISKSFQTKVPFWIQLRQRHSKAELRGIINRCCFLISGASATRNAQTPGCSSLACTVRSVRTKALLFADATRMLHVLQKLSPSSQGSKSLIAGLRLSICILTRHHRSYNMSV